MTNILKIVLSDVNFLDVVKNSKSIPDILRHYNVICAGRNNSSLRKYLMSSNIDISHIFMGSTLKGLTKENSGIIRKSSETYKKRYEEGKIQNWAKGLNKNTDGRIMKTSKKISKTISDRVKDGNWHYSFSKVRTHKYNSKFVGDVNLMGSWELEFAKYLDNNDIEWKRPKDKFYYEYPELKQGRGYYTPDFYLVKEDLFVEIKGYETEKDRAKWKWFPHKLKVLKREDLVIHPYNLILSDKNQNKI